MKRPSTTALVALLAGATFFGGAVLAQAGDQDNRDVPVDGGGDTSIDESAGLGRAPFDADVQTYTVPASAFAADGNTPDSIFYPFGGGYFRGTSANYGCMVAPVQLPQGARINSLVATVRDDASLNLTLVLRRVDLATGTSTIMATVSSDGASTTIQRITDDSVVDDVVDNVNFTYSLTTCVLDLEIRLYSAQLTYQEDLAIDPHSPILVPVTPFRVYDSRLSEGPIAQGANRVVSIKQQIDIVTGAVLDPNAVPAGATAIMFNLAVTDTVGGGFVAVTPGDAATFSSASINWTATGQTFNNGTFVQVDGDRKVKAFLDGTLGAQANIVIDVTGYLLPAS